ncbi:MAG: ABC transporter permease [Rhodovarius sp.]|nr:ABC transporter permease [Rhodovarius sp.]
MQVRPGSIIDGARVQAQVVGALILRELHTRFGRHHLGYLWVFIEPMILAGALATLHSVKDMAMPGGLDPAAFYIVGYTPYYLFRAIINRAPSGARANAPLFYHRQVTYHDVMLARNILDIFSVMLAVFIMIAGLASLNDKHWPQDPFKIAVGILYIGALCHGFSLLLLAGTKYGHDTVERLVHPFTYLMIPFTGAFIMAWWLPTSLREWYLLIPTVHMFELIREGQFGSAVPHHYDLVYMTSSVVIMNLLGLMALNAVRGQLTEQH